MRPVELTNPTGEAKNGVLRLDSGDSDSKREGHIGNPRIQLAADWSRLTQGRRTKTDGSFGS